MICEENPSNFADIYIMKADGTGQKRLTNVFGYDGGPFFTQDGKKIIWRRFDEQGLMRLRIASINDLPIKESERKYHWPLGRRPDDHPSLSDLGL